MFKLTLSLIRCFIRSLEPIKDPAEIAKAVKKSSTLWSRRRAAAAMIASDAEAMTTSSVVTLESGEKYILRPAGASSVLRQARVRVDHAPHLLPGAAITGTFVMPKGS